MKSRRFHLYLNQHYPQIKHSLLIGLGMLLLVFSTVSLSNQNRLLKRNEELAKATKQLSEQNKTLNEQSHALARQNQDIAKTSQNYIRCIAHLFADYTKNFVPITIEDLDTCRVSTGSQAASTSGGSASATPSALPLFSGSSSSSSKNTPLGETKQPESSQAPPSGDLLQQALGIVNDATKCIMVPVTDLLKQCE